MNESQNENTEELKQNQRAIERLRFLKMLKWLQNKTLKFSMFQGAQVEAQLRSIDYDILNIHVHTLQTPIGCVPEALLRFNDINFIKYTNE
jgi:hypothetical protein